MGLGTSRRGMKSPPLLIAVLLACVFVLGINYWITSTRCVELQSRIMELEGRIRRAAAERGAVEMKKNEFEDMLTKQKNQIDTIQSLHSSQMQNAQILCKSEKENILSNISTKESLIQNLQAEIANIQKQLEDCKLEFKKLQDSQAKKSSYELTQCSNKIAEVHEQCEERIRRLMAKDGNAENEEEEKDTVVSKLKIKSVTLKQDINQKASDIKEEQKHNAVIATAENAEKEDALLPGNKEQTKNVPVDEKKLDPSPQQSKIQVEKGEKEEVTHSEVNPNLADEDDNEPKVEDAEDPDKEAENYEVERENLINMDGPPEDEKVTKKIQQDKEKVNDYNGDDANEAESETEKQVELGAYDQSLKGAKSGNDLKIIAVNQPAKDSDDARLK